MKRCFLCVLSCMLFLAFSFTSMAEDPLMEADALFEKGDANWDINSIFESIPLYLEVVEANPNSYEANWKCARAHREYANLAFQQDLDEWKAICKKYGKDGMKYGKKAIELEPNKIEGHYYYGLCVGSYSDGVSIINLGRFWHLLPWPLKSRKKSLKYFEEHQKYFPNDPQGQVYYAELLIEKRKKKQARTLLEKAAASDHPYYSKRAKELLEKL